jgi:hypothetical protein
MGLSVRTLGWRYTAWVGFSYGTDPTPGLDLPTQGQMAGIVGPDWGDLRGEELYDHRADDAATAAAADPGNDFDTSELEDIAGDAAFAAVKRSLRALLQAHFPSKALSSR